METLNSSPISAEVVSHQMMGIDGDEDPAEGLLISEKFHMDNKGKSIMEYDQSWKHQIQDKRSPAPSVQVSYRDAPTTWKKDDLVQEPENSEEDLDDYESDDSYGDFSIYDHAMELQAQFDALDAPPGREVEVNFALLDQPSCSQNESTSRGSSVPNELNFCIQKENGEAEEILKKYEQFKQFDTVDDFSDHKYKDEFSKSNKVSKTWSKTIQNDWKILEKDLLVG